MAPSIRFLSKDDCAFTASRRPTALSVVLQEVEDHHGVASLPHIIARMTEVENWPDLESAVRAATSVFLHPQDRFTHHSDKKQLFDASFLRHSSDAFPVTTDEDQEVVTVTISPTITMTVRRKMRRRDDPLHFRLTFQNPEEGASAVHRYKEFDRSGPRSVAIDEYTFENAITFTAKFGGHTVLSRAAVELLGDRLSYQPSRSSFDRCEVVSITPHAGETLVAYGGNPSYVLGLSLTQEEKRLRHPNEAAIASILSPDGGGITFFYRLASPERGRGRGYDRIDAFVDPALPIAPEPQRERGDEYYEDGDWGEPPWRGEY